LKYLFYIYYEVKKKET